MRLLKGLFWTQSMSINIRWSTQHHNIRHTSLAGWIAAWLSVYVRLSWEVHGSSSFHDRNEWQHFESVFFHGKTWELSILSEGWIWIWPTGGSVELGNIKQGGVQTPPRRWGELAAARILSMALLHTSTENRHGLGYHTDLPCHKRLS